MAINVEGIKPQGKRFHNETINVYPTHIPLEKINFWEGNNRTIFTFDRLKRLKKKKKISEISIAEITKFIAEQDIHKLPLLAKSIARNGVQVPMLVSDDGKLLDGNRRFFACHWLKMEAERRGEKIPSTIFEIPVLVVRRKDLDETLELKILAEANFIPDLKVAWPLDAQSRSVEEFYKKIRKKKTLGHEEAINEIVAVFGISRQRVLDFLGTLSLTKKFIRQGINVDKKIRRREIVEDKFVYFWELLNKSTKGRNALDSETELNDLNKLFFMMMDMGRDSPIKNVKQIEPFVQAKRDRGLWSILKKSKGAKLSLIVSIINEKKEVRKSDDKIRLFLSWLKEQGEFSAAASAYLLEVIKVAKKKVAIK